MTHRHTPRSALLFALACVGLVAPLSACGPNVARLAAEDTARTAATAITEVESSGGEVPDLAPAVEEAELWLRRAERAIELWGSQRSLAYETVAPCLARSLDDMRAALVAAGRPVPASLESAQASAAAVTDAQCPRPDPARARSH